MRPGSRIGQTGVIVGLFWKFQNLRGGAASSDSTGRALAADFRHGDLYRLETRRTARAAQSRRRSRRGNYCCLQVTRECNDQGRSCRSSADRGRASALLKGRVGFLSVGNLSFREQMDDASQRTWTCEESSVALSAERE